MSEKRLGFGQHGLEATAGSAVAATFKWMGEVMFDPLDVIATPERDYATGVFGGNIEGAYVAETGSELTLPDTSFSFEAFAWLLNMAVKSIVGPATAFAFTFPTTTPNTIKTFTWEWASRTQAYQIPYCFVPEFEINGDTGSNNGRIMLNAKVRGRKAAPATATAALGFLASMDYASIHNTTIHFDSLGTAAGTAAARTGFMKGFSINVKTGWNEGRYADGRADKDFSLHEFSDWEITGNIKALFNANGATELANARAGSGRVVGIKINGASPRLCHCKMPMIFDKAPQLGSEENGLILVTFPFHVGYSRTATAQAPEFAVTLSSLTTIT